VSGVPRYFGPAGVHSSGSVHSYTLAHKSKPTLNSCLISHLLKYCVEDECWPRRPYICAVPWGIDWYTVDIFSAREGQAHKAKPRQIRWTTVTIT